jgi:hypothetical protein
MMFTDQKWQAIREHATRLGVKWENLRKWRRSGVPPRWQIELIRSNPDMFSLSDFEPENNKAAQLKSSGVAA